MKALKEWGVRFWKDEDGIGTLEMLLIIAVVLVVAVAFRKWIIAWVNRLFEKTESDMNNTLNQTTIDNPEF